MASDIFSISHAITQKVLEKAAQISNQAHAIQNSMAEEVSELRNKKASLVTEKARLVSGKKSLRIVGLFYQDLADEISTHFESRGHKARIYRDIEYIQSDPEPYDIFFTTSNYLLNSERLSAVAEYMTRYGGNGVSCIWLWDHHHMFGGSLSLASYFDIVFPIHETAADYIKIVNAHVMNSLPAASYQFGPGHDVAQMYAAVGNGPRSDALYGGFREYPNMSRNAILRECIEQIPGNALYLRPQGAVDDAYYSLPTNQDRFANWTACKTSLSVSISTDIPIRIFDALAAGQIPLVCSNINGFDHIISVEDQLALPIIRFSHYDLHEIRRAYETALKRFDQDGAEGAYRRHSYAIRRHMMLNRVAHMIATLRLHFM